MGEKGMAVTYSVYAFDAYGTLFDVHAAVRRYASAFGPQADALSEMWRTKQLEYSWNRSLMGRYRDFWALTEDALDYCFARIGRVDLPLRAQLLDAYFSLECYEEVPGLLARLRAGGAKLAILSNGTPKMLAAAIANAGIGALLDAVISVDEMRIFKTAPQIYQNLIDRFGVPPGEISFQSSNRWDIAGAAAMGLRTVWINRSNAPDEYTDLPPAAIRQSLVGLLAL